MGNSPHTTPIHVLDDYSLLHVFHLYRPFISGEDENDNTLLFGGRERWARGRWWYRLAHVCQRWRNVIFGSSSYLGLSLVCTHGTPVADMLAHSPPLPLVVDYFQLDVGITEDEEGAILALKQRDRIHRVRFRTPVTGLQTLIGAMDAEYPILEYLIIAPPLEDNTVLILPDTLQAPHLRHLTLEGFALPIGSRLLTTAVGLVTLSLLMRHPPTHFHPNTLLHWLSFMPQLETLSIFFSTPVPNHETERQLTHMPIIAPVTLPNLHYFRFRGVGTYLEAFVHRITTPHLEKLQIDFFNQLTFPIPRLVQLLNTTERSRFDSAAVFLDEKRGLVQVYPGRDPEAKMKTLNIAVLCGHLDWQVSFVAQIFNSLSQIFSAVERLTLNHKVHVWSSEEHNKVDRTEWHKFLRPFKNVKSLHISDGLVEQLSRSLELEDGELPLDLLPKLQELMYPGSDNTDDTFASFVNARQNADLPVPDQDDPALVSHAQIFPVITPGSNEAGSNLDP